MSKDTPFEGNFLVSLFLEQDRVMRIEKSTVLRGVRFVAMSPPPEMSISHPRWSEFAKK